MAKKSTGKKKTQSKYDDNPLAYVAASPIHGRGLFARKVIKKGEYIGTYEGRPSKKNGMHVLWVWDEEAERWDGIDGKNEMRFANHADEPNAEFWGDEMYALKKIRKDEEITFDYQWDKDEDEL
ncbi:MAG: hypothetical protein Tsb002_05750 [Wenzhouxiangellaceae bacterium]